MEGQYGKPYDFSQKRRQVARATADALPGAFDDFYHFTTTHPELSDVLGHNLHQGLPKRLDMSDMSAVPGQDDWLHR